MIGPLRLTTTGVYPLTNVSENAAGALVLQTRLASGTGVTWALRKRLTGTAPGNSNPGVTAVADAAAPRCVFRNALLETTVDSVTAVTATTAPQIHSVICDGCDVLLEVLSVTGNGVLLVELAPITGGT